MEVRKEEQSVPVFANSVTSVKEEKKADVTKREVKHLNYEELSSVQLKVLEILQSQGQLKANQISEGFPEMNPRTIRRELKGLKEMKIISSMGGGKMTVYKINESY
jgi:Fe2+ or Zn2+ uptake regulation protein